MIAHAPFNFVPLSSDIYYPSWGEQISLEIPFEKSYTGYVEFQITAKSPLFVRNSCTKLQGDKVKKICSDISIVINDEIINKLSIRNLSSKDKDSRIQIELKNNATYWKKRFTELFKEKMEQDDILYLMFSNVQNLFFIPATSLKGCFRNALEIISFGKIGDRFSDDRYGFREMTSLYLNGMNVDSIHCGYLEINEGLMKISDHGIPYRISHKALDEGIEELNFESEYGANYNRSKISPFHKKSILEKCMKRDKIQKDLIKFTEIGESYGRKLVKIDKIHGNIEGDIIVTGQPGEREITKGKYYEFVFPKEEEQKYVYSVEGTLYKDFIFINKNEESEIWLTWKKQLDSGNKVPIFFTIEDGKIRDLGFSYMYKRPFKQKISDCVYENHFSDKMDMAECIFGRIGNEALKGRVQFTNAFADNAVLGEGLIERLILGSPKASYYPFYLEQKSNRLISYQNTQDAIINGWKKYPIRKGCCMKSVNNAKLDSFLIPLDKGTTFRCRMNYFNLNGKELGALLSVLTFHGSNDEYCHSIGQGKPYGLGKIKVDLNEFMVNDEKIKKDQIANRIVLFMKTFEKDLLRTIYKDNSSFVSWNDTPNVTEFYTMSYDVLSASDSLLQYMDLNDFPIYKRKGEYLKRFSKICKNEKQPKSLL